MEGEEWLQGNLPVNEWLNLRRELWRLRENPLTPFLLKLRGSEVTVIYDEVSRYRLAYEFFYLGLLRYLTDMSVAVRWERDPRWLHGQQLGPRQRKVAEQYHSLEHFFEYDFVNCLIHPRILCDRTIGLARYFLNGPRLPSFQSFHDHKRFFISFRDNSGAHEEYVAYFRNNSSWFDMPLKPVRDKYIVHHGPKYMRFLGYHSDYDLQMVILVPNNPDSQAPFQKINALQVSIRRLARDVSDFLTWFGGYGLRSLPHTG